MCGKSYVMDKFSEMEEELRKEGIVFEPVRIKKYTTREYREEEFEQIHDGHEDRVDVCSVEELPEDCDLVYQTYGKKYGLKKALLQDMLDKGKCPIVVINDVRVVEELKKEFASRVLALYIFREIPKYDSYVNVAKQRGGVDDVETTDRFNKAIAIHRTYIENISLFDRVILNVKNYTGKSGEMDCTRLQIKNIIKGVMDSKIKLSTKNKRSEKLFIICGNAASGKDDIIQSINTMGKLQAFILPKYTSRAQDIDDGAEMICQFIPRADIMENLEKETTNERKVIRAGMFFCNKEKTPEEESKINKLLRKVKSPKERFLQKINEYKLEKYLDFCYENETDISDFYAFRSRAYKRDERVNGDGGFFFDSMEKTVDINKHPFSCYGNNSSQLNYGDALLKKLEKESYSSQIKQIKSKILEKLSTEGKEKFTKFEERLENDIIDKFFIKNPEYVDLQAIKDANRDIIEKTTKNQEPGMTGPCYCIQNNGDCFVMYENNQTLYGFSIETSHNGQPCNFIKKRMEEEKKHCVLVASLIDIYGICREKFSKDRVITVFSYSQISAEEYLAESRDGTTARKAKGFAKEIEKYSKYIADFDYVTIYAESLMGNNAGGSKEELVDQMFRLFRAYN